MGFERCRIPRDAPRCAAATLAPISLEALAMPVKALRGGRVYAMIELSGGASGQITV
jgi:hypothetical protein